MPEYDYSRAKEVADRLIARFGRPITLKQWSRTPADPTRPWRGAAPTVGDPPAENRLTLSLHGVFVPPNQVRIFGLSALGDSTEYVDLMTFSEQIIITYPGDNDVRSYMVVNDGVQDYGVTAVQILKPGPEQILAFIGVRR
jgi:hypothetical protein